MKTTIPLSTFHQFTDNINDLSTELVVNTGDSIVEIGTGSNMICLNREQVEQLHECFRDWLSGNSDSHKWSDFWSSALK